MSDQARYLAQVEKLAGSQTLHGSDSLCKLLRYLAQHSIEHPGTSIKEYQIATELFGRPADFDPQVDSMVRVQAGRLRSKLAEYYGNEGADDTVWVELPKGNYLLNFGERPLPAGKNYGHANGNEERGKEGGKERRIGLIGAVVALAVLLAAALISIAVLMAGRKAATASPNADGAAEAQPIAASYALFWHAYLDGPEEPLVVYSNAAFVGRPDIGLRYYDKRRDGNAVIFDQYTGVGEVLAVHDLDGVFGLMHRGIRVKRGSLFSLDDAKNNDLVFIGSPSENLTLLEIPGTREFRFQEVPDGPRKGNMEITNVHPEKGEAREFLASPSNVPLTEDYAVVALVRGLNPERSVVILAGTTTLGTQAAVEYVCSPDSLKELLGRLAVSKPDELKPFEALLHVKVTKGVPVGSELVAVRKVAP